MKRFILFFLIAVFYQQVSIAQYWQQQVNYIIDVKLNEKEKTLDVFEKLTYINNSPDTLHFIWFHLWPNAYKTDATAFSEQALENGSTDFYFSDKDKKGYINRLDFKVNNVTARVEDHPQHIDVVKIILPQPLLPKQQIIITTPFHVKLPYIFSRSGFDKGVFQVTQWYPKPAVYDSKGWHPMPYLDQGEFYSEFGSYEVAITAPENFVIAATGILQNKDEAQWLQNRKTFSDTTNATTNIEKTLIFKQENIHDFAFFASKNFIVDHDTLNLSSGRVIDVFSYYTPQHKEAWSNSIQFSKDAVRTRSNWIGEYPYEVVSVVQGSSNFAGGMEYPTITVISPMENETLLDEVIAHEIGHNWFYGILASQERLHPWMDEGLNSFYDHRYYNLKYADKGSFKIGGTPVSTNNFLDILLKTFVVQKRDQPISTAAADFSNANYSAVAYHKTANWVALLEEELGKDAFDAAMKNYYQQWKFKHPYPEDFKESLEGSTGKDLTKIFSLLHKKGSLKNDTAKGLNIVTPFSISSIANYIKSPSKKLLLISPAAGFNSYDKLMIGGFITNYKLPPSKLQFFAAPLYATGSKQLNGIGKINFGLYSSGFIHKTEVFINGASFSMNDFTDAEGNKTITKFQKVVPGLRLTLRENNSRSTVRKYLQWKSFLIAEDEFRFSIDSVFTGTDTSLVLSVRTENENRSLHQLQFVYQNFRALYPFDFSLQVEQGENFVKPTLTANYFFNYAKGGGLSVRFFAGKFFYTGTKTFQKEIQTDRYHINMTGSNGYEDYTYSDYFVGRNKFEGIASQQIMIKDGGFKIRTDLLAEKIGKTDDWLMAVNFNTTVPKNINPLSILPIKIPLRIFADIGSTATAWERNSEMDRFLFDAGLHIPLLNETINLYFPVIYSSVFGDYVKSTIPKNKFFKTMSFTINLNTKFVKQLNRELLF